MPDYPNVMISEEVKLYIELMLNNLTSKIDYLNGNTYICYFHSNKKVMYQILEKNVWYLSYEAFWIDFDNELYFENMVKHMKEIITKYFGTPKELNWFSR